MFAHQILWTAYMRPFVLLFITWARACSFGSPSVVYEINLCIPVTYVVKVAVSVYRTFRIRVGLDCSIRSPERGDVLKTLKHIPSILFIRASSPASSTGQMWHQTTP